MENRKRKKRECRKRKKNVIDDRLITMKTGLVWSGLVKREGRKQAKRFYNIFMKERIKLYPNHLL